MSGRLAFFFSFFLINSLLAQTVKWSPVIQTNRKAEYMQILGATDNADFFLLRSNLSLENDRERAGIRNRLYILGYYSAELSPIWEKELKTSYLDGHVTDVFMNNGKVLVTGYISNKKREYFKSGYERSRKHTSGEFVIKHNFWKFPAP